MRGYGAPLPKRNAPAALLYDEGDYDNDYANDDRRNAMPPPGTAIKRKANRDGNTLNDDDEDGQRNLNPHQRQMLKDHQLSVPVRRGALVPRMMPAELQAALAVVLAHPRNVELPEDLRDKLQRDLDVCEDEFTVIDPMVQLCKTLSTGTCNIYLKEAVPVSRYLMVRALRAQYTVQITTKIKTTPLPYDDNELIVKPFRRPGGFPRDRYAAFGITALDLRELCTDEVLEQVDAYMVSLGPLSPTMASNPQWLDEQVDSVSALLRGERVVLKPKPQPARYMY